MIRGLLLIVFATLLTACENISFGEVGTAATGSAAAAVT